MRSDTTRSHLLSRNAVAVAIVLGPLCEPKEKAQQLHFPESVSESIANGRGPWEQIEDRTVKDHRNEPPHIVEVAEASLPSLRLPSSYLAFNRRTNWRHPDMGREMANGSFFFRSELFVSFCSLCNLPASGL